MESRKKITKEIEEENIKYNLNLSEDKKKDIIEAKVKKEVEQGVQTIQYQVTTLMTTNGQAPFLTVFMYLNEAKNEQEKH